jgi:hypothetical protein
MSLKGKTYRERLDNQLEEWVKGNPIHNTVENECTPDFSCCNKSLLQPEIIRTTFAKADSETQMKMLMQFLSNGILSAHPDAKIHITDGSSFNPSNN